MCIIALLLTTTTILVHIPAAPHLGYCRTSLTTSLLLVLPLQCSLYTALRTVLLKHRSCFLSAHNLPVASHLIQIKIQNLAGVCKTLTMWFLLPKLPQASVSSLKMGVVRQTA